MVLCTNIETHRHTQTTILSTQVPLGLVTIQIQYTVLYKIMLKNNITFLHATRYTCMKFMVSVDPHTHTHPHPSENKK